MKMTQVSITACGVVALATSAALGGGRIDTTHTSSDVKQAIESNVGEAAAPRDGQVVNFNVTNIPSVDGLGDPNNFVAAIDVAAALGQPSGTPVTMNGIGWDVVITAHADVGIGSWLSEIRVYFDDNINPDQNGLFLAVGAGDSFPGENVYTNQIIKLADLGTSDIELPDGLLRMEFYESFDDVNDVADGLWKGGSLFIQAVADCDEPVWCFLDGIDTQVPRGAADSAWRTYDVKPGDVLDVMEICALSGCENAARVEMFARPPFMEPAGHQKSSPGYPACIETKANDVVEAGFAEGTYWAKFRCVDLGNGNESILKIGYNYTDPEPEPEPMLACAEDEAQSPNDVFADASVIDAGECADAFGVNIYGVLDMPVFINGDVDYYKVIGLTPGETYEATIVAGLNPDNAFTDTMLGWMSADGVTIAMDDNSGSIEGFSKISFAADADGAATLAITGHGDDDFDGMMDAAMPYEEFGFGGYMLSISVEEPVDMPIERQADLNGDGVVDTGDLGVLLGLFGIVTD